MNQTTKHAISGSRLVLALVLMLAAAAGAYAQGQQGRTGKELADFIKDNYTKQEVYIPMRDGVRLFTIVYAPKDTGASYPILLNRTPYSIAPYNKDGQTIHRAALGPNYLFAEQGYIFVYQDVRGRYMSEGEFVNVRPDIENKTPKDIDESTDTYDTIEWLVKNVPNHNGSVGMYGISYPGFYTSAGSIDSHPALKACSPQAPVSDWFTGDDMHHNGALFLTQNFNFFSSVGQPRSKPVADNSYLIPWKGQRPVDAYKFFLELGGLKEVADHYEKVFGIRIPYWDELMANPNYDQYWKDRNILPKLKNIKCATMTVGGWYDNEDLYGALRTYQYIERQNPGIYNVLVVGPWDHGGWSRADGDWLGTAHFTEKTGDYYRRRIEIPFFDKFLKGKGSVDEIGEVTLFDTGSHKWTRHDSYDPKEGVDSALYLGANGSLSFSKPTARLAFDEYVSDPMNPVPYTQKIVNNYPRDFMTEDQRFASTRPDVLVYQTAPLEKDITVVGDVMPDLFVSSSGTDSDFVVKLIDVFPDDYEYPAAGGKSATGQMERVSPPANSAWSVFAPGGYQMLLRGEPMPARFRKGFERPVPLTPNKPENLSFVMPGVAHTFKKGHRIMVQIQSTWFPLVARSPQKFMPNYKLGTKNDFRKATQRVYHSASMPSSIRLKVVR